MATRTKSKKSAPGQIRAEDVKNANLTPIFSNNVQLQISPQDVWLCFNEVNPTGTSDPAGFTVERRANIIVTVPQFFAMVQIMNGQVQELQKQMQAMAAASQKARAAQIAKT